jgi:hypothetical protein
MTIRIQKEPTADRGDCGGPKREFSKRLIQNDKQQNHREENPSDQGPEEPPPLLRWSEVPGFTVPVLLTYYELSMSDRPLRSGEVR